MRKLFFIALILFIATACYADQKVYLTDPTDGSIIHPMGDARSISNTQVVINTTATSIGSTGSIVALVLANSPNNTGNSMYIGDSGVTVSNGLFLASGQVLRLNMHTANGVYAVCGNSGNKLSVIIERE